MYLATQILAIVLVMTGLIIATINEYNKGYEEGMNNYKYVKDDATYSTTIDGKKVEYTYRKINELMAKDLNKK